MKNRRQILISKIHLVPGTSTIISLVSIREISARVAAGPALVASHEKVI